MICPDEEKNSTVIKWIAIAWVTIIVPVVTLFILIYFFPK